MIARIFGKPPFKIACLLAALAAISLPAASRADVDLVFGTYTADKPSDTVRLYKPFLKYLETELAVVLNEPVNIRMKITGKYAASIDDLATGKVDFSRFGPASYITVKDKNDGIEIIAMESKNGKKTFKGIIAIHADSDISNLTDLRGKRFAFGDPLSTIGRYLSQNELLKAGITGEDLRSFDFLGRHDLVGTSVGLGKHDAGALKESTFKKLVSKNTPIKSLVEFNNVTKPWLAKSDMDPKVLDAMRQVMLAATDETALRGIAESGFLQGTDADYDTIRTSMKRSQGF